MLSAVTCVGVVLLFASNASFGLLSLSCVHYSTQPHAGLKLPCMFSVCFLHMCNDIVMMISPSPIALIRGSVASQSVRTSYISIYILLYVCAAVSGQETSKNASVPDSMVWGSTRVSDGCIVISDPLALHWSIQPRVSDGCLELFSKPADVRRPWLGVHNGPPLLQVQLQIRADRLYDFIQRGMMAIQGGKLKVFARLVSGAELYSLIVRVDGSVPAIMSTPPPPVMSQDGDWRLYGGFLKACVDCVVWSWNGVHWSMQPKSYGGITLYADLKQTTYKYPYYQKPATLGVFGSAPEIDQVVLTISEQAASRIISPCWKCRHIERQFSQPWFPLPTTLRLPSSTSDGNRQTMSIEKLLWMSGEEIAIPGKPLVTIHSQLVGLAEYSLEQYSHFISMAINRPHLVFTLLPNPEESFVMVVIDYAQHCRTIRLRQYMNVACDCCDSTILFGGHTLREGDYGTYEYGLMHNDIEIRDEVAWTPGCNLCSACFSTECYLAHYLTQSSERRQRILAGIGYAGRMWIQNVAEAAERVDLWEAERWA